MMPPHPRIGRDHTVAKFGASYKQHMTPSRSFGHFFHLQAPACPLPTSVRNDLRAPPAQRDDGDKHALPSRHRLSQAAAAPAVVAAWQSTWAHLPTMAPICRTPDASTLQRTARTTLPNVCELRNSTFAITRDATNNQSAETARPQSIN